MIKIIYSLILEKKIYLFYLKKKYHYQKIITVKLFLQLKILITIYLSYEKISLTINKNIEGNF